MNWLDIIIILLLLVAVWEGWREGMVTQILGLAALGLGIFLGWRYGGEIGAWLGMENVMAHVVGFFVVLAAVVLLIILIGRMTRGLFRVVGLRAFDNLLGVLFSALKMVLFVGLVMLLFEVMDPAGSVIPEDIKESSVMYGIVDGVCDVVFPFVRDMFRSL
jgi:membrane protein required for colicin V production